jgi:hypothetical protein
MSRTRPTRDEVIRAVVDSVKTIAPDVGSVDASTHLLGPRAVVDSVGFVTLLIEIEQQLASAVDLSNALMECGDLTAPSHPFATVGALTAHVESLLDGR